MATSHNRSPVEHEHDPLGWDAFVTTRRQVVCATNRGLSLVAHKVDFLRRLTALFEQRFSKLWLERFP